jgi:hypothetical protein
MFTHWKLLPLAPESLQEASALLKGLSLATWT